MNHLETKSLQREMGAIVHELQVRFPEAPADHVDAAVRVAAADVVDGARIPTYLTIFIRRLAQARLQDLYGDSAERAGRRSG